MQIVNGKYVKTYTSMAENKSTYEINKVNDFCDDKCDHCDFSRLVWSWWTSQATSDYGNGFLTNIRIS